MISSTSGPRGTSKVPTYFGHVCNSMGKRFSNLTSKKSLNFPVFDFYPSKSTWMHGLGQGPSEKGTKVMMPSLYQTWDPPKVPTYLCHVEKSRKND